MSECVCESPARDDTVYFNVLHHNVPQYLNDMFLQGENVYNTRYHNTTI